MTAGQLVLHFEEPTPPFFVVAKVEAGRWSYLWERSKDLTFGNALDFLTRYATHEDARGARDARLLGDDPTVLVWGVNLGSSAMCQDCRAFIDKGALVFAVDHAGSTRGYCGTCRKAQLEDASKWAAKQQARRDRTRPST